MEIQEYLDVLWRRQWVIFLSTLMTVAVVTVGSLLQQPTYTAVATVRVAQATGGSIEYADYLYAERLMNTYGQLLESRPLLGEVIRRLDLQRSSGDLAANIEIDIPLNTELLRISVVDHDPETAKDVADMLAALLVEQSQSLYFGGGKSARVILQEQLSAIEADLEKHRTALQALLESPQANQEEIDAARNRLGLEQEIYSRLLVQYEESRLAEAARANSVSIVEPAVLPTQPSSPRTSLNLVLGLLAGLILGVALAFLFETLNPVLHSSQDLEDSTALPLLATIPWSAALARAKGASSFARASLALAEPYRMLRTNLISASDDGPPRSVLVTSAEPGAGKSTIAANLAAALATSGHRVIILDCDFRRPSIHRIFGNAATPGLSEVLLQQYAVSATLQDTQVSGLQMMSSGRSPANPTELLGSRIMRGLLATLAKRADVLIIDSPPVLAVADATILAPLVEQIVLVAGKDRVTERLIKRAEEQLRHVGAHPAGIVFNMAAPSDAGYYYAYSQYGTGRGAAVRGSSVVGRLALVVGAAAATVLGFFVLVGTIDGLGVSRSDAGIDAAAIMPSPSAMAAATDTAAFTPSQTPSPSLPKATATAPQVSAETVALDQALGITHDTVPRPLRESTEDASAYPEVATPTPQDLFPQLNTSPTPEARPAATVAVPQTVTSKRGIIPFRSGYLFDDPYDQNSGVLLVPANWRVEILEENIPGSLAYGSDLWHKVRVEFVTGIFEGYMPTYLVEIEE